MKTTFIVIVIIVGLIIVFQIYTSMAIAKTETQTYKVIKVDKEFEIRYYPSVTMAMITSSAKTYKELGSYGFTKLARYIFGGNKDKRQIAMTSPVHMAIGDSASTMSFVMPTNFNKDNLPIPNDSDVTIKTVSEEYVAAIKFGGFASDDIIRKFKLMLEVALKKQHINYYGTFRFLGYNPPYQLFGRRNEIIISVDWNSTSNK